ncbi:MAG TPA: hypothetical protein VFW75_14630 [Acetobacteraceae bacterium]|nr:hypothetical protein [Acetobacteraceae bacterium]
MDQATHQAVRGIKVESGSAPGLIATWYYVRGSQQSVRGDRSAVDLLDNGDEVPNTGAVNSHGGCVTSMTPPGSFGVAETLGVGN